MQQVNVPTQISRRLIVVDEVVQETDIASRVDRPRLNGVHFSPPRTCGNRVVDTPWDESWCSPGLALDRRTA